MLQPNPLASLSITTKLTKHFWLMRIHTSRLDAGQLTKMWGIYSYNEIKADASLWTGKSLAHVVESVFVRIREDSSHVVFSDNGRVINWLHGDWNVTEKKGCAKLAFCRIPEPGVDKNLRLRLRDQAKDFASHVNAITAQQTADLLRRLMPRLYPFRLEFLALDTELIIRLFVYSLEAIHRTFPSFASMAVSAMPIPVPMILGEIADMFSGENHAKFRVDEGECNAFSLAYSELRALEILRGFSDELAVETTQRVTFEVPTVCNIQHEWGEGWAVNNATEMLNKGIAALK